MSQKPSIIYMGTPDFAVTPLQQLVEQGYDIKAVITVPDKPAGRGQKLRTSAVKNYAVSQDLKVLQPTKMKDPAFLQELQALDADLFIVIAFRMLPKEVWRMPKLGTFNIHGSLLPEYRGAAPINWAIINGEQKTGVTSFFINEAIDTGSMIDRIEREITSEDTAGSLHDKLMEDAGVLVLRTVEKIASGDVAEIPQDLNGIYKEAPKIFKEDCRIDWNKGKSEIYNFIRGLSPYPVAFNEVYDGEKKIGGLRVYKASFSEFDQEGKTGELRIREGKMLVRSADGWLELHEIQWPGKKKMDVKSFLNGFRAPEIIELL